jgi:hypothetical protein
MLGWWAENCEKKKDLQITSKNSMHANRGYTDYVNLFCIKCKSVITRIIIANHTSALWNISNNMCPFLV